MEYRDAILNKWLYAYKRFAPRYYPAMLWGILQRLEPARQLDEKIDTIMQQVEKDVSALPKQEIITYLSGFQFDRWKATKNEKKKLMVFDGNYSMLAYLYTDPQFKDQLDECELNRAANCIMYRENPSPFYWDWINSVTELWSPSNTRFRLSPELRKLIQIWEALSARCQSSLWKEIRDDFYEGP